MSCIDICCWIKKLDKGSVNHKMLVKDVSIIGSGGQMIAVLGPSGAGKTTLLDCVTFNLASNLAMGGKIMICGQSVK